MIITVDKNIFVSTFMESYRRDDFSYEALEALFDYYDRLDEECGTQTELDVVAICCDWCECDKDMLISDYGYLLDREEDQSDEDYVGALLDELNDNTTVLEVNDDSYLVAEF